MLRTLWGLILAASLWAPAALAQVEDAPREYRELLSLCLDTEDFLCAFDVLMEHGELEGMPPVAVSVEGGPTAFGALMFAIIDRSEGRLDLNTRKSLAEQAIGYTFDAQPEQPYAVGPFLLLYGEICRGLEDRACVLQAGQSVQLFLEQDLWYYRGVSGGRDVPERAAEFVSHFRELTQ